jgi:hypothetical protein
VLADSSVSTRVIEQGIRIMQENQPHGQSRRADHYVYNIKHYKKYLARWIKVKDSCILHEARIKIKTKIAIIREWRKSRGLRKKSNSRSLDIKTAKFDR